MYIVVYHIHTCILRGKQAFTSTAWHLSISLTGGNVCAITKLKQVTRVVKSSNVEMNWTQKNAAECMLFVLSGLLLAGLAHALTKNVYYSFDDVKICSS